MCLREERQQVSAEKQRLTPLTRMPLLRSDRVMARASTEQRESRWQLPSHLHRLDVPDEFEEPAYRQDVRSYHQGSACPQRVSRLGCDPRRAAAPWTRI